MQCMAFNPMYYYVNCFRDLALYASTPTLGEALICIGFAIATLIIGYCIFKRMQKKFILYV